MKIQSKVKVRTTRGLVEVDAFHVWQETILDVTMAFVLHVDPVRPTQLMISDVATGYATGARIVIPKQMQGMTLKDALRLPGRTVRRQSRTAFHHLLNRVGRLNFLQGVAKAQILVAKQGEDLNNVYEGVKHADSSPSNDSE